ncbi:MAG: hypothetical protein ETSY2_30850 [Candidatus Entotheonella gemina]|uniref:PIN domain-containing protein n=1 Tax=Candidatus Entotheonella gemina TaxID=1429439 RepID=W4M1R1_9BACT|nr:MAG: hypothetical protein ETSY2_30850 [Candidatus Entotheonella gemina]
MNRLFADAFYWVALFSPRDSWHERVRAFAASLQTYHLYTTEEVLTEFLAYYSSTDSIYRLRAARWVRILLDDPRLSILPQTHDNFMDGLALYEARADKHYSLIDCISMQAMRRENLTDVLTNDHHFRQEGFRILFE